MVSSGGAGFDEFRTGARLVTRPCVHSGLAMGLASTKGLETHKAQQMVEKPRMQAGTQALPGTI